MPRIIHCTIHLLPAYKFTAYGDYHKYLPGNERSKKNARKRAENDKKYWESHLAKPQQRHPLWRIFEL